MPRRKLDRHFEDDRPEWTERKHRLLERIVIPAAEKMKQINRSLALVDGYAGPNTYGGTIQGSTAILCEAASRVIARGVRVRVFACEPLPDRYGQLVQNLRNHIDSGMLTAYPASHANSLPTIMKEVDGWPGIVFLDPHGPKDLGLERDVRPWLRRPRTDVLGVFMANAAARACAEAIGASSSEVSCQ